MKSATHKIRASMLMSGLLFGTAALLGAATLLGPSDSSAQAPPQGAQTPQATRPAAASPRGMQLCVFSSGRLNLDKSILQNGPSGRIQVPAGFFLIRHPRGNVLFDTGNNDRIINEPSYWGR